VIPTLHFTVEREIEQVPIADEQIIAPVSEIKEIEALQNFTPVVNQMEKAEKTDWLALLPFAYTLVTAIILFIGIKKLAVLLQHTKQKTTAVNGLKLLNKTDGFTNCSFFNYVFIDEKSLSAKEIEVLLQHEKVHAEQYHSVDKIFLMLVKAVLWFNPVVYLWDRALEQNHEFEADQITSEAFGNHSYAGLLLKLAVGESQNTLIHNFVKSPVKERIKMLFNSKSKNMKKLAYLLVTPLVLGLIWGFTVEVVEVFPSSNLVSVVADKDPILNKTIKGKVDSISGTKIWKVLHFKVGNQIYRLRHDIPAKIKVGDELTVTIGGRMDKMTITNHQKNEELIYDAPVYLIKQAISSTGELLIKAPEKHAFLYEANKARFTTSKIESIKRNSAGYASEIVLNDGDFKISLDVAALKTKADNFKVGNEVTAKFIGERLTGKKTYTTNQLITLYSISKKAKIINPVLYSKFYTKEGFQVVRGGKPKPLEVTTISEDQVKIISASETKSYVSRGITNLKNAVLQIGKTKIEAEKVTLDSKSGSLIAEIATIYFSDGKIKKSKVVMYNIKKQAYTFHEFAVEQKVEEKKNIISGPGNEGELELSKDVSIAKMRYQASDSVRVNRVLESMLLSGKAELDIEKYKAKGKVIHLDNLNKTITVFLGSVRDESNLKIEAEVIEIDLKNNRYTTKNHFK